jgi:hypothetical protein
VVRPALRGRLVEEGGDRRRPLLGGSERVARRQRHRLDRAIGDQGVAAADGEAFVAQGEVGERVVRAGDSRCQARVDRPGDQGRSKGAGADEQGAHVEHGGHRLGKQAPEATHQRHPGAEPDRHPRDLGDRAAQAEVGADVVVVDEQAEGAVGEGDRDRGRGRSQHGPALAADGPGHEAAGLAAEQPRQERLHERLLHVETLDDVQDGAAGEQDDRSQPGGAVSPPQPAAEQQQADAGGRHRHCGVLRHHPGDEVVEQPQPLPLGGQQGRHQVDGPGQGSQSGRQAGHPVAPPGRRAG